VEGVNVLGILLGYLAVLALGGPSLAALGLLIARKTKMARIFFAAGLLAAGAIAAAATLTFLAREYNPDGRETPWIVLSALSLLLAGAGQFVAALRGPWAYAAAQGCAAGSLALLASPSLSGDWGGPVLSGIGRWVAELGLPFGVVSSLVAAVAGVGIAVFLPAGPHREGGRRAEAEGPPPAGR
jgi:hypothetical protein